MYAWRVRARIERLDEDHASALKTLQELEERGLRLGLDRLVAWSLHDQLLLALDTKQTVHVDELSRRLAYVASPWADERGNVRSEIGLAAAMARAELAVNAQSHDESASVHVAAAIPCAHRPTRPMAAIRAPTRTE